MIYFIGQPTTPSLKYQRATFDYFREWASRQLELQHDVETNVTDFLSDRELITVQFGDIDNRNQFVLQWSEITDEESQFVKELLENKRITKLIHNVSFEYTIWRRYNVTLENIYDTMLVEKVLFTGWKTKLGFYSLAGLVKRYLYQDMSKEEQKTFGDNVLTESKIVYAADDVKPLGYIRRLQRYRMQEEDLETVIALEMEVSLSYGDMVYNGMGFDADAWRGNMDLAQPLVDEAREELNEYLRGELRTNAIKHGYLLDKDTPQFNWKSPKDKKKAFDRLYPDLEGSSVPIIKKYLKGKDPEDSTYEPLRAYVKKDTSLLDALLITEHKEYLIEQGLLIPKDSVVVNWNSHIDRLKIFKWVEPHLKGTGKEDRADCDHPMIDAYENYTENQKLLSSFGEAFIEKFVETDGKVRTTFDQIKSTGRVGCKRPNMQQIPAKESVGNRYRNCFITEPGRLFVDSDYASQELVIIAHLSGDDVWQTALRKGQDLHSVCAEVVYKDKWLDAADPTCCYYYQVYYNEKTKKWLTQEDYAAQQPDGDWELLGPKQKCSCKKHKTLRTLVKTINFG